MPKYGDFEVGVVTPRRALLGVGLLGFGGLAAIVALYFQLTLVMGACTGPGCAAGGAPLAHVRDVVQTIAAIGVSMVATGLLFLAPVLRPAPRQRAAASALPAPRATAAARAAATVTLAVRDADS